MDPQPPTDQDWLRLVEERFPADLEAQARERKAFGRVRGLPAARHLLRGRLSDVLSHSSFRDVSVWSRLIGLTSKIISSQAWEKRLLARADGLWWLFHALLAAPQGHVSEQSQRILLVDATPVFCPDKRADTWRVHPADNLLAGRLAWLRIRTRHVGDLVVGDGASSRAKQRLAVAAAQAFGLVRSSAAHWPRDAPAAPVWSQEHRWDGLAWWRTLPPGLYERQAMVVQQEHGLPVRLMALVLPDEQAEV